MMDGDLSWTTQLGDAFVNQPSDVMNSIQRLRAQAQDLGNLTSNPEEDVETDDGDIEIMPTNPDLLYVPFYDPGVVFYQRPYGRAFITFGAGFGIGLWLNHDFDWHGHNLVVLGPRTIRVRRTTGARVPPNAANSSPTPASIMRLRASNNIGPLW